MGSTASRSTRAAACPRAARIAAATRRIVRRASGLGHREESRNGKRATTKHGRRHFLHWSLRRLEQTGAHFQTRESTYRTRPELRSARPELRSVGSAAAAGRRILRSGHRFANDRSLRLPVPIPTSKRPRSAPTQIFGRRGILQRSCSPRCTFTPSPSSPPSVWHALGGCRGLSRWSSSQTAFSQMMARVLSLLLDYDAASIAVHPTMTIAPSRGNSGPPGARSGTHFCAAFAALEGLLC